MRWESAIEDSAWIQHGIISKERSTSVRNKLGKFRQVE